MKFFMPLIKTPEETESLYKTVKDLAQHNVGYPITQRKIFRIEYVHNGIKQEAEVGQECTANREVVVAILESFVYLICTRSRGAFDGIPIHVGIHDATLVEDFDP